MSTRKVEIAGPRQFIEVNGPYGVEIVSCDVCGSIEGCDNSAEAWNEVSEYFENPGCFTIDEVSGYFYRLVSPGYTDCTDWSGPFDSAEAARKAVIEAYDL